jgi:hypothetical protein
MYRSNRKAAVALTAAIFVTAPAFAADVDTNQQARAEFLTATDHVKSARWGEALAAFERSAALRPHALTTYNIGACERALGRYTRARATLKKALAADEASGKRELPKSFGEDAARWIAEIDSLLVVASVTLVPADATLFVDGAPLRRERDVNALVAGLPTGEESVNAPGGSFTMQIDPGDHIFALSRAGFASGVVTKSLVAGSKPALKLDIQRLPATIRVSANQPGAVVSIDDLDTGVAPVEVSRPGGTYRVLVRKSGFLPYSTTVRVNPGEQPSLQATLAEETKPLYRKFWFWSVATVVVAGVAVGTYFLTRPEPERPAPNGGGLGWVVSVPAPGSR